MQASRGNTGITETTDYRGVEVLALYSYIPRTGWGFVAKQDLRELYTPIRIMLRNLLILFIVAGFIVYAVAIVVSNNIARPVLEMTEVSKKIREGDLSARNLLVSKNEFGYLAQSFNRMADSIVSQIIVQRGVTDIAGTIVKAFDLAGFIRGLLKKLMDIIGSEMVAFYEYNPDENRFEHFNTIGISTALPREIITIPVVVRDSVKAIISLASLHEYSKEQVEIIKKIILYGFKIIPHTLLSIHTYTCTGCLTPISLS